jgi:hypothetical protein
VLALRLLGGIVLRLLLALVLALGLAEAAAAQPNDITGTWTWSSQSTRGETAMVYIMTYGPGGRLDMQQVVPGITKSFVGRWGFDGTTLQYVLDDWEPKQDCGQGFCYPVPSGFPIGQVFTLTPRFTTPNSFDVMDASGPLLWVRDPNR